MTPNRNRRGTELRGCTGSGVKPLSVSRRETGEPGELWSHYSVPERGLNHRLTLSKKQDIAAQKIPGHKMQYTSLGLSQVCEC